MCHHWERTGKVWNLCRTGCWEGKFRLIPKETLEASCEGVYGKGRGPIKGRKSRSRVPKVRKNTAKLEAVPCNERVRARAGGKWGRKLESPG